MLADVRGTFTMSTPLNSAQPVSPAFGVSEEIYADLMTAISTSGKLYTSDGSWEYDTSTHAMK